VNTQSESGPTLDWIPRAGIHLRKAGVQFDAVRVDGEMGRELADILETMTGGDPGPIVAEANGKKSVYFLVAPGATANRPWPPEATRLTGIQDGSICYIPVPALNGLTWPLSWRCRPSGPGRFVHPLLLWRALGALLE
jgi:hypothetical protein